MKYFYYIFTVSVAIVFIGCAAENSKPSNSENPYYHVEKVETDQGEQLDKITISGPPTPPEGYDRPVVEPNITHKNDDHTAP